MQEDSGFMSRNSWTSLKLLINIYQITSFIADVQYFLEQYTVIHS